MGGWCFRRNFGRRYSRWGFLTLGVAFGLLFFQIHTLLKFAVVFVNAACRINKLLFTSIKRMTIRTNFYMDFGCCSTNRGLVATCTLNCYFIILRMNFLRMQINNVNKYYYYIIIFLMMLFFSIYNQIIFIILEIIMIINILLNYDN